MKKIVVFLLLLVVLCVVFCGCATVRYSVIISDYGARVIDYTVIFDKVQPLNPQEFEAVKTFFEFLKSRNDHSEVIYDESNPKQIIFRITYEDQDDYYISNGITGDEPNEPAEGNADGLFMDYEVTLLNYEKADFMIYALTYLPFYDSEFNTKLAFFINPNTADSDIRSILSEVKASSTPSDTLKDYLETSDLRAKLADETEKLLMVQGYDFSKVDIYFDYSHVYKSITAKDADEVSTIETEMGKQTMYTWKLDPLSSNEITIYQRVPNVWVWELIAVIFGIVVAAACIAAFILKKNKFDKQVASISTSDGGQRTNVNEDNAIFTGTAESSESPDDDGLFDVYRTNATNTTANDNNNVADTNENNTTNTNEENN